MDGSEADGDLVLIQIFFALLWKLFLKIQFSIRITSWNNLIYIINQEGLYQNEVTLSLAFMHSCKMVYWYYELKPKSGAALGGRVLGVRKKKLCGLLVLN